MTEFEIDAAFNTICRPGRVVRILTKNGKEENVPIRVWKRWTIVKEFWESEEDAFNNPLCLCVIDDSSLWFPIEEE